MTDLAIEQRNESVTFEVRVIPRSSKSQVVGVLAGALKVKLKSPPVEGAANEELIRLLASMLEVSRSDVAIVSGPTSKKKRIRIHGIDAAQIHAVLKAKS